MKLFAVVAAGLALSFAAFTLAADKDTKPAPAAAPTTQKSATTKPINKYCAVEQENEIDPKVPTVQYQGKTIGFCCEDCIPKFKADPEKYMTTLK